MATLEVVEHEISLLCGFMKKLGKQNSDGNYETTFKVLFDDTDVANTLESLVGTLKAAKKRKIVSYGPEMLLQGMSDAVVITMLKDTSKAEESAAADSASAMAAE